MTRLEEVNGEVSMWSSVRWLGYLSGLNLLIALCLGLYARWERTAETMLLVIFVLALIVLMLPLGEKKETEEKKLTSKDDDLTVL